MEYLQLEMREKLSYQGGKCCQCCAVSNTGGSISLSFALNKWASENYVLVQVQYALHVNLP